MQSFNLLNLFLFNASSEARNQWKVQNVFKKQLFLSAKSLAKPWLSFYQT